MSDRQKKKRKQRKRGYRKFFTRSPKGVVPWNASSQRKGNKNHTKSSSSDSSEKASNEQLLINKCIKSPDFPGSYTHEFDEGEFVGFEVHEETWSQCSSLEASIECNIRTPSQLANSLRVLALFDGIGTGLVVLEKLGLQVEAYFSCEINEKALAVQRFNLFGKVIELGSVTNLTEEVLASLGRIDLLIGGSPCSDISLVSSRKKGIQDKSSTGWLFYEYNRVLKYLLRKGKSEGISLMWLFENTSAIEREVLLEINSELGCKPVMRCTSAYVPMRRKSFFWGNIPFLHEKGDSSIKTELTLQDFLKPYRQANTKILPTLTTTKFECSGSNKRFPVVEDGKEVRLFISEIECLLGFPMHYTAGPNLSITERRKLLGRAWSLNVIEDILRPLCALYKSSYLESLVF